MPLILDDEMDKMVKASKSAGPILLGGLNVFFMMLIVYGLALFAHRDRFGENDCVMVPNDAGIQVFYRISTVHKGYYSANIYMLDPYNWPYWVKYEPVLGKRMINFGTEVDRRYCGYMGDRRGGH
jgi:hypothetical protein